jgi:hypothetical protein
VYESVLLHGAIIYFALSKADEFQNGRASRVQLFQGQL